MASARALLRLVLLTVAGWLVLLAHPQNADAAWWVELRVSADDALVDVAADGKALVEHQITLHIAGGPLRELKIEGIDPAAELESDAYAVKESEAKKGSLKHAVPIELTMVLPEDGTPQADPAHLVLRFGEDGLRRGTYRLVIRYRVDLHMGGRIVGDGAMTRIEWTGLRWDDGLDGARVTFALPAAPTPPRANNPAESADPESPVIPPTFLSTLRREGSRDELELLRPYAPKGEAVTWSLLVDRRAVPARATVTADTPETEAPPIADRRPLSAVLRGDATRGLSWALGAGIAVIFGALVLLKGLWARRTARAAGARARPLIPLPIPVRAPLAGGLLVLGIALQLTQKDGLGGTLLVLLAALCAAQRTPDWGKRRLRGPGRWIPVTEREAFAVVEPPVGAWLDVGTWRGRLLFVVLAGALFGGAAILAERSIYRGVLLGLDIVPLVALFFTGRSRDDKPDPAVAPGPYLRNVLRGLRALEPRAHVEPQVRIPKGSPDPDEVRLVARPEHALPGFRSLEVGVLYQTGTGGPIAVPQLLLRLEDESPAAAELSSLAESAPSKRGREAGELVVTLTPRLYAAHVTATLAAAVLKRTSVAAQIASSPQPAQSPKPQPKAKSKPVPGYDKTAPRILSRPQKASRNAGATRARSSRPRAGADGRA